MVETKGYGEFHSIFLEGQALIKKAAEGLSMEDRDDGDAVDQCVAEQWGRLQETDFAVTMLRDADLQELHRSLEHGMSTWIGAWADDPDGAPSVEAAESLRRWAGVECFFRQRRLEFWGRLGGILYHYRDQGRSLPTHFERNQRAVIRSQASRLRDTVETLLSDPLVLALYQPATIKALKHMSKDCVELDERLSSSPLDISEGPNPFHDSDGLIRSQFLTAFGLLAVELYGYVTLTAMDNAMEIKSDTAERLGLVPWRYRIDAKAPDQQLSEESQQAMLRGSVRSVLERGLSIGKRRRWITFPLAQFYARHWSRRRELDREERQRNKRAVMPNPIDGLEHFFQSSRSRTPDR